MGRDAAIAGIRTLSHMRARAVSCAHEVGKGIVPGKKKNQRGNKKCLQAKLQQECGRGLKANGNIHKALCDGMRQVRGELRGLAPLCPQKHVSTSRKSRTLKKPGYL